MQNAERFAIGAVVAGLRKSNAINDAALRTIADELERAVDLAANYDSFGADTIGRLADDVRKLQSG